MRNLVFIATLIYIIGVMMGLYLPISIVFLLSFIFGTLTLYIFTKVNKKLIFIIILITLFSALYSRYRCNLFEEKYKNINEVNIIGKIVDIESKNDNIITYKVKVRELDNLVKFYGTNIIIKVKNNKINLNLGDIIQVDGKVKQPEVRRNYKGFDYKKYLNSKNIYTVVQAKSVKVIKENNTSNVFTLKNIIINNMESTLSKTSSSICLALIIGYKVNIPDDINEHFKDSNLLHILAISGIHVTYINIIINYVLGKFSKKSSKILNIIFLFMYMILANFIPSVFRACIMQMMILISSLLYKKSNLYTNISISALILLIINPLMIYNIGFIFSYVGTISLIIFNTYIKKCIDYLEIKLSGKLTMKVPKEKNRLVLIIVKIYSKAKEIVIITLSANILLIPLSMYLFNSFSLNFIVSNLLVQPILSYIIIISIIQIIISIFSIKLASVFSIFTDIIIKFFIHVVTFCANIPFSKLLVTTPSIITLIFIYSIIFILVYLDKRKVLNKNNIYMFFKRVRYIIRIPVVCTIITVLTIVFIYIKCDFNELKVFFIDVGQGDSTLIITPNNKKILIDGGGSEFGSFDVGEKTLLPYLLSRKIKNIDYVIISHFDSDHVRTEYLQLWSKSKLTKL